MIKIYTLSTILSCLLASAACTAADDVAQAPTVSKTKRDSGPVIDGCTLTIKTDKDVYTVGGLVLLEATLKNNSNRIVHMSGMLPLEEYKISVLLPNHENAPKLLYLGQLSKRTHLSKRYLSLKPGDQLKEEINISRAYDMSLDGTYTVTVQRAIEDENKPTIIVSIPSNTISFIMSDDDQKYQQSIIIHGEKSLY